MHSGLAGNTSRNSIPEGSVIPVEEQPPPADFDTTVRRRGQRFLQNNPHPTAHELSRRPYWRSAIKGLYDAYGGICAYTSHWMAWDTGSNTVEHFVPKSIAPQLAYEWSNFRLVCGRMNGRKRSHQDVLDPFRLNNGVFWLDFPSLQVKPSDHLPRPLRDRAWSTISRLDLNDETCCDSRLAYVTEYCIGGVSLDHLRRRAPFLHRELTRQGMVAPQLCRIMGLTPDGGRP